MTTQQQPSQSDRKVSKNEFDQLFPKKKITIQQQPLSDRKMSKDEFDQLYSKSKRPFYKKTWFWVLTVIVMIIILNNVDNKNEPATASGNTKSESNTAMEKAEEQAAAIEEVPHIGETIKVGKLNVSLLKGPAIESTVGGSLKHKARGMFWLIRVGVGNKDKESRTIDNSMFQLIGPDGKTYDPDSTAGIYANSDNPFFLEKINPGIDLEGFVIFDMPADLKNTKDFKLRVFSGIGFKGITHVDFILKHR